MKLLAVIAAKASVVLEPGVPLWIATWVVLSQFGIELRYQAYKREHEGRLIKITLFGLLALMLSAQGLAVATLAGASGCPVVIVTMRKSCDNHGAMALPT